MPRKAAATPRVVRVPRPHRRTETRHHPKGLTCHHYAFFGMMCDEYDRLRARAGGRCEICGTPEAATGGKRLVIDHFEDERTRLSFIRGMLCDRCNAVVMACMDGMKPWGPGRKHEAEARLYEARSWQQPSIEQWTLVEEIRRRRQAHLRREPCELPALSTPAPPPPRKRYARIPLGDADATTEALRKAMSPEELTALVKRLQS